MKKQTILFTIFLLYSTFKVNGQCNTDNLFPVKIGMKKYQVINSLNLKDNVYEIKDLYNLWDKKDYLKGDSIYRSQVNFKFSSHPCIKSSDNVAILKFADQKLYQITFRIWFDPKDFSTCLENYNQILETLKKEFPFYKSSNVYGIGDEQIGEGYWLYKSKEEMKKSKFEGINIQYTIEYEQKWNQTTKKMIEQEMLINTVWK
jgi:hypothetical protein